MKYFLIIVTVFCFSFTSENPLEKNFEGIILYKRVSSNGNIIYNKYYFKGQNLRTEKEVHLEEGVMNYTSIFLFGDEPNVSYQYDNISQTFKKRDFKAANVQSISKVEEKETKVMEYDCSTFEILHQSNYDLGTELNASQKVWLSNDLQFKIPDTWNNSPYMVSHWDGRIILKMEEKWSSEFTSGSGYIREAIEIEEMELSDKLFDVN